MPLVDLRPPFPIRASRHMRDACDPSNYAKVHKKKKCPVKNCKEKLTSINSFECKQCRATVCLKHRLADDHACPGKPPQVSRSNSLLRGPWSSFFSSSSGAPPASAKSTQGKGGAAPKVSVPQSGGKLSSIARKVTGSVQSQLQEYRASHQSNRGSAPPQPVAAAKAPSGGAQERCPQCGSMFPSVQALIDHAAAVHLDGWSSGAGLRTAPTGGGEFERCPHCSAQFGDPVELVRHVESMHGGRQGSEVCVLC